MKTRIAPMTAFVAIIGVLFGCGGSVSLVNVWTDPEYHGANIDKILVVGIAPREQTRSIFEYQLKYEFNANGVYAMASLDEMPKDEEISKETFIKYFKDHNVDAVLITGLLRADTSESYVPGHTYYVPGHSYAFSSGYHRDYYGYYHSHWRMYHEPGYYKEKREYMIESTLYETTKGNIIWRGISKTVNPDNIMIVIEDLSKTLVKRLGKDGLVTLIKQK